MKVNIINDDGSPIISFPIDSISGQNPKGQDYDFKFSKDKISIHFKRNDND